MKRTRGKVDQARRRLLFGLGVGGVAGFGAGFLTGGSGASAPQVSSPVTYPDSYVLPTSYLVFKDARDPLKPYKARNGMTAAVDFSGTDAGAVIQEAISATDAGGSMFIRSGAYSGTTSPKNGKSISIVAEGGAVFSGFSMPAFTRSLSNVARPVTLTPNGPLDGGDFGPNSVLESTS
ncbi:MAG TPA: hypothetical protein VMS77_10230 [Conexivisphaerales archaeon]|nr:hypothetical protein [Conexivisphaerales archaeon]